MLQIPEEKLKDFLLKDGVLTAEQFAEFSKKASTGKKSALDLMLSAKIFTEEYYKGVLAKFFNVPVTTLDPGSIDTRTINLIPETLARNKHVLPFSRELNGTVNVAMENPSDLATIEFLERKFDARINPYLATPADLARVFSLYEKQQVEGFRKVIQENIEASLRATSGKKDKEAATEIPIISITDNIISYAESLRASDIHIEALEEEILVRYRIDGILHEIIRMQKEIHSAIVARFKILSGMKLDEHTKPQDGRFRHISNERQIDIRVSILPTLYGEKVEMRLLASSNQVLSFEDLGMLPETITILKNNITKSFGIVLITGPTGSGKSTTLYSILGAVNKPEVNIVTVEDPIEYDMKYINQTQINEAAGVSFASALRAILRQDPNIIMVGEIRDADTAEISVHAALTGHLVLSSLHTNDAPTSIPRLVDMGIAPFLIAAVLNTALAQRLVRRLCTECIYSYPAPEDVIQTIQKQLTEIGLAEEVKIPKTFFKGKGCPSCGGTGYRGRLGIYEMLEVTEDIRSYIPSPEFSVDKLRVMARKNGMKSMFEDGLLKAGRGNTSIEEVLRVIRE